MISHRMDGCTMTTSVAYYDQKINTYVHAYIAS